jgi:hypothetical protein
LFDKRVRLYLIQKLKEELAEDFKLAESYIETVIEHYNLKKLISTAKIEIVRLKKRDSTSSNQG